MTVSSPSSRRAFTLIELLVVISIIAILMTLLFPALDKAMDGARRAQARNDAVQIAAAINAYYTEYGKLPDQSDYGSNNEKLMNLLSGAASEAAANPRQQTFLAVPRAKNGKNGAVSGGGGAFSSGYKDPWGHDYQIVMDFDYDDQVEVPSGVGTVHKSVVVWSKGGKEADYDKPDKWLKSWE